MGNELGVIERVCDWWMGRLACIVSCGIELGHRQRWRGCSVPWLRADWACGVTLAGHCVAAAVAVADAAVVVVAGCVVFFRVAVMARV